MAQPATSDLRRSIVKQLLLPALVLLLVPAVTVVFARHGEAKLDASVLELADSVLARSDELTGEQRARARAFWVAHPITRSCDDPDPRLARVRQVMCRPFAETWQFVQAERLGWATGALGLAALLLAGGLGLVAFWNRRAQYWSFVLGWRSLQLVTAVETVAQGVLLVWLSYWMTALFFERYYPKLILMMAVLVGLSVILIVVALLKRPPPLEPLEAERVAEGDAPALWARVKDLAARLGTAPPTTVAAGIDDNFFVTEQPLPLPDGAPTGARLLYVSLPLLRTLAPSEADAVLGHELAHFHGGDTAASARLQPALVRYGGYVSTLAEGPLSKPAAAVMQLFRVIFELALQREQRRRELVADAEAARLTSADDVGRALLKIAGYAGFRARTEQELFGQRSVHQGSLALRERIEQGLPAYAASPHFLEQVREQEVPHPFDSHPPIEERLAAVKAGVGFADAGALLAERPERSWADEVLTAGAIEERLWGAYEERFKANHELSLAWRYLPSTEEERAHVLRFFPDLGFPSKNGEVRLSYAELVGPDGARIALAEVEAAKIDDGTFSKTLVLTRRGASGKDRTFKVDLRALGKGADPFKEAFARYWQRDQVARGQQEANG